MRVIAIRNSGEKEVNIYGYGEYLGKKPCSELGNIKNPCIKLDNGKTVWGYQCWWGNAEKVEKEIIKDKKVNIVEVEEV